MFESELQKDEDIESLPAFKEYNILGNYVNIVVKQYEQTTKRMLKPKRASFPFYSMFSSFYLKSNITGMK
jgi:hypothetical protein